jgi:integrase
MRRKLPLFVKPVTAKGKTYYYFRTGKLDERGKEMLTPLPDLNDLGAFGGSYASCLAARSRRAEVKTELTVAGLIDLYERSPKFKSLSQGSQRLYGYSLAYLGKMLPTAPAGLLERQDVARLIDGRANQPGAANSLLRTINAMYKWARARGHVSNDPGRDVEELEMGEHDPWPDHVVTAAKLSSDDRVRLGVHLLLYTAQRIGDVVRMRWTDIEDGKITVTQQKTKRTLVIQIHEELAAELAKHARHIGYIIPGQRGRPIHQHTLREALQVFAAEHGAKVVPHGLRKNAVNELLHAGCSAAEAAAISGQSLAMVEHYAKARAQGKLASAAVLKWQRHR